MQTNMHACLQVVLFLSCKSRQLWQWSLRFDCPARPAVVCPVHSITGMPDHYSVRSLSALNVPLFTLIAELISLKLERHPSVCRHHTLNPIN